MYDVMLKYDVHVQFEIYVNEGKFIICNIDNALNSMQFDIIVQNFLN